VRIFLAFVPRWAVFQRARFAWVVTMMELANRHDVRRAEEQIRPQFGGYQVVDYF
jgi:hypothetical protein